MTPTDAKALCIKAHVGQWRRPRYITNEQYKENNIVIDRWLEKENQDAIIVNENKITWNEPKMRIEIAEPYHTHPIAVADMMTTDEEKIVAYLHDVIEDTFYTLADLRDAGVPSKCLHAINKLTKIKCDKYDIYIAGIATMELSRKAKLADIFHNMSDNPTETQRKKYLKAIPILLKAL